MGQFDVLDGWVSFRYVVLVLDILGYVFLYPHSASDIPFKMAFNLFVHIRIIGFKVRLLHNKCELGVEHT